MVFQVLPERKRVGTAVMFIHKKDIGTVWLEEGWDLMLSLHNVLYRMEKTYQLFRWKKEERESRIVSLVY